jgi:hypothetical protein
MYDFMDVLESQFNMSFAFSNNVCWDAPMIGVVVDDYVKFLNSEAMEEMKEFCKKYDLPEPTFYGGICGEYE